MPEFKQMLRILSWERKQRKWRIRSKESEMHVLISKQFPFLAISRQNETPKQLRKEWLQFSLGGWSWRTKRKMGVESGVSVMWTTEKNWTHRKHQVVAPLLFSKSWAETDCQEISGALFHWVNITWWKRHPGVNHLRWCRWWCKRCFLRCAWMGPQVEGIYKEKKRGHRR